MTEKFKFYIIKWGQVLEISFKTQHKFQSVWTKMILKPTHDTDFVMRTWSKKLGKFWVRWFPRYWKLKDHKVREKFQCKILLPDMGSEEGQAQWNAYHKNYNFEQYMSKLKAKSYTQVMDKSKIKIWDFLLWFARTPPTLFGDPHLWKIAQSHSLTWPTRQSFKDKKKNMTSSKGKAVGVSPKPLTHSRGKSNYDKRTEDTHSLLTQLLRFLVN